ncbi:MAG: ABC transporter ATP-binding protein [Atopobium sp.]|uniref:ABC transporter ATP-binding protein n=1 Tax=Atopobium sp. TaxID=1872650 RepID=UPI002A81CB32|nr:ABC transporter ATP-binding protein [Atopobium sp.]MDY4523093.1 ABC transporter ATP-binding protein [Atopobium sp.]
MLSEKFKKTFALTDAGIASIRKGIAWSVVTNLVNMTGIGILFILIQALMAAFLQGAPLPTLLPYAGALIVFCIISFVVHSQQYFHTYGTVYSEVGRLRLALGERMRQLPLSFFGHRDLADLAETIMGDVAELEHMWSHVLGYLYGAYISTFIVAVSLFIYDWRLALAALWSVPVAFGLLFGLRNITSSAQKKARTAALTVSDQIQETIEEVQGIRANNLEKQRLASVFKKIDAREQATIHSEILTGITINAASVIMCLGIASTVLVGATLITAGQLDFMVFVAFLLVVTRVYAPFDQALALIAEMFVSEVGARRLQNIYDEPIAGGEQEFAPQGFDVQFEHVGFSYQNEPVLRDASFTAKEGEVTALVGPSGSGKSTCARLVARLWDANTGTIRIGGIDTAAIDPEVLLSDISIVFQDVMLFDNNIMENIRLGRRGATDEEVRAAARAANCDEFVSRLPEGYNTFIGENGARLSGGERQRISIARALLKDAPILLLDEATASLDVENETIVQEALSRLLAHKTVLVIAHRMRTVENADKVVVLDEGHVIEEGSPQELLQQEGVFAHMVKLQRESATWQL